jgi:uncharacterized protein YbbC (DUF1343 family)
VSVIFGIDQINSDLVRTKGWGRCGLVSNQASVDRNLRPSWQVLCDALKSDLVCLFGPQHGFESAVQDNMVETGHTIHRPTGLPIHSLYSETREPTGEMLRNVDTIIVDLQIIGSRVYTYKYTLSACLRAAVKHDKRVVVLDRPNPLGGEFIDGHLLDIGVKSFVGEFSIPMRHGLSVGEAALFFNQEIGACLDVVTLKNYSPQQLWNQLDRQWVITSPNMPTFEAAFLFPGTVLLEATNLSEGRGTCLPFSFVGAPYISDVHDYAKRVADLVDFDMSSIYLRPTIFQPTFQKWAGEVCNGLQLHALKFQPSLSTYGLGLALIIAAKECETSDFSFKAPPYEYEYVKSPMDLVTGIPNSEQLICKGQAWLSDTSWQKDLSTYIERAQKIFLYPREMKICNL